MKERIIVIVGSVLHVIIGESQVTAFISRTFNLLINAVKHNMTPLTALLGLVVGVCFIIYRWSTYTFDFWQKRNVVGPQPTALLGNYKAVLFGKMSFGQWLAENYQNYSNAPIVGVFKVRQPIAIIRDPDLIKHVLMRDFIKFPDRGKKTFEKAKPLSQHLLNLDYPKWKPLRNQFSPAFNPRKLREMFLLLCECGDHFQDCLEKRITTEDMIDCHDLTACFTTDVIGTCAFGLQMQAIADKQSVFRNMGKYILDMDWKKLIKFRIKECMPWFYSFLAPVVHDSMVTDFFSTIMKETIDHRRRYNVDKHDIIHQIMEIQDHLDKFDFKITDTLLAAQLFGFFLGGFETSSTTMSNALYELAQNHDCQNQLRDEIRQVLDSNDNVLTYDLVKSMTYLDKVFKGMHISLT